jgi:hypothetical protein
MSPQRLEEFRGTMLWYFKTIVEPSNYSTTLGQAARLFDELHGHIESNTEPEPGTLAGIWRLCTEFAPPRQVFCSTREGRLGTVPNQAQTGDIICLFHGGKFPTSSGHARRESMS